MVKIKRVVIIPKILANEELWYEEKAERVRRSTSPIRVIWRYLDCKKGCAKWFWSENHIC